MGANTPDTGGWAEGEEEGLTWEEGAGWVSGSRLSFQPCSFVIGALERKFCCPLLTS